MTSEKITLYANILKESAAQELYDTMRTFSVPPEEYRQKDLQYIIAVLVSSGMNLNGAIFLPSELIHARDTVLHKPLDVEHLEGFIVGHIYDRAFMLKDRKIIDPVAFLVEKGASIDKEAIDIAVAMSLYKTRFPDIANDVADGKYKVSMECFYKDFDIKVGDLIISKDEANKIGILYDGKDSLIGKSVKLVEGNKEISVSPIGRVLREILFSGCGLVEFPANPDSDILETASTFNSEPLSSSITIDLEKSETYMKRKQEKERLEITDTKNPEVSSLNDIVPPSQNPGTCVSYKRYVYEYEGDNSQGPYDEENQPPLSHSPGVGGTISPLDKLIHEKWCSLFEMECTSLGADATHPNCLRNVLNKTTKEAVEALIDKYPESPQMEDQIDSSNLSELKSALDRAKLILKK